MRLRVISILLIFTLALSALSGCLRQKKRIYKMDSTVMDTLVSITVVADSEDQAQKAIDAAIAEIKDLEDKLSFWTETSEIAAINRNAGVHGVDVSPVTLQIIKDSIYLSNKTMGAFDPTIGPVIRQWDFRNKTKPDAKKLAEALGRVDYRALEIDGSTVFLSRKGMLFDTGGIAKGYAADRAEAVLKGMGIRSGLIAVAGDIKAFGVKPDGRPWRVGIRNPRATGEDDDIMAALELQDQAISTSGDYERFFIEDGKRYHHLLDPRTGYPARGLISVSVVTDRAVLTDGFATGIFVLGPEEGKQVMGKEGLEGLLITEDGDITVSEGLKKKLTWTLDFKNESQSIRP